MRKIIQIAFDPWVNSETNSYNDAVSVDGGSNKYILCDDGTVWWWSTTNKEWVLDEDYQKLPQ